MQYPDISLRHIHADFEAKKITVHQMAQRTANALSLFTRDRKGYAGLYRFEDAMEKVETSFQYNDVCEAMFFWCVENGLRIEL
jgi:hypothetical protein